MGTKFGSEGSGILWCHPGGTNCITSVEAENDSQDPKRYFTHAKEGDESHYKELSRLATDMNELVAKAERLEKQGGKRDALLQIGFLRTRGGFLPVWKRNVVQSERIEDLVDPSSMKPLGSMSDQEVKSYLQIESDFDGEGEWHTHRPRYLSLQRRWKLLFCDGCLPRWFQDHTG